MDRKYNMISQPINMDIKLYPHQLTNVYSMEKLEYEKNIELDNNENIYTNIGINANIPGSGKTLSMVTLLLRDKMPWDLEMKYLREVSTIYCNNFIKKINRIYYTKINCSVVLCGNTSIHQWENDLKYTNLNFHKINCKSSLENIDMNNLDVILLTPLFFNEFIFTYQRIAWKRFIYDDPEKCKVKSMKSINFGFMWIISSEPYMLTEKYKCFKKNFMNSIFKDKYFNHILKYIIIKDDINFIKKSFIIPEINNIYYSCYSPIYSLVKDIVDKNISKMIEEGNIKGVINSLGGKETDNIIDLLKEKKIQDIKENNIEKEIINEINLIENKFQDIFKETCSICYNKKTKPVLEPNCQNIFCGSCLLLWLQTKPTCPLCRQHVDNKNLIYINTENKNYNENKLPTREEKIIDIINKKTDNKYIIFSDWDESFNNIRFLLKDNLMNFVEIKGSSINRAKKLEKFKKGDINILFLNSNTDDSGINLQETTDLILYHSMNDDIKSQIINKINRIGRSNPLKIHHLLV